MLHPRKQHDVSIAIYQAFLHISECFNEKTVFFLSELVSNPLEHEKVPNKEFKSELDECRQHPA